MKADKKMVDRGKVIGSVPGKYLFIFCPSFKIYRGTIFNTYFSIIGVKIGDQFFSRCEMIAIGLHCHWLGGIDTIPASSKNKLVVI